MAINLSLPIVYDSSDGFAMNYSVVRAIRQNLKMLILTIPGERVMMPEYGVGLARYLFSNYSEGVDSKIEIKIKDQVERYMPSISINQISFDSSDKDSGKLSIRINYSIPNLGTSDLLQFTI